MSFDVKDFASQLVDGYSRVAKAGSDAGAEAERNRLLPLLAGIYAAYDHALQHDARVPTLVMAAVERARSVTGNLRTPLSVVRQRNIGEGIGEHGDIGMSTRGSPLKAGQ